MLRIPLKISAALAERIHVRPTRQAAAIGLLLLLTVAYFWPFVFRGEVIAPTDILLGFPPWSSLAPNDFAAKNIVRSDIVDNYLPTFKQIKEGVNNGDLPLWTPLTAQGRPLAIALSSSFFHPLMLFFITLFPLAKGFSLLVMSKLFLAGLFTYLFLRRLDVSRSGSLLGGLAYMFSGFNIVWLMWPHTLVSSFGPLLFLQTENLVRNPRPGNSALLGLVIAVMVLGGFPAVAGYFFYAVGLYFLVRLAQTLLGSGDWKRALWTAGVFGLSFLLGVGITAFQLLPTLEHVDFIDISYRERLSAASLPGEQAVQLVFPNFYGNQVFGNFRGIVNLNETSGYVGIVTLVLALFGLATGLLRQRGRVVFFGALALVSLPLIYGIGPFLGWVSHLPVFNLNPNFRLLSVFGFAAAVAAAFGFDELRRLRPSGWYRPALLSLVGIAGVILAGVIGYLGYEIVDRREILSAFLDDFPVMEFDTFRLVTVAFGLSLAMLFAILVFLHLWRPLPSFALASVVLILVASDLLFFGYRQNPTIPDEYFYPETPAIRFLQTNLEPYERIAPFDRSFMVPTGPQLFYGLNSSFSHTLHSERQRDLIRAFSPKPFASATSLAPKSQGTDFSSPIIDLLGIRFVTVPYETDLFQREPALQERYDLVYSRQGELRIYENKRSAPAFLVSNVVLLDNPAAILESTRRSDFNPREEAFVEEALPAQWATAVDQTGETASSVTVVRYEPETVAYEIEASQRALLVTPELDHPGWRAFVDEEPTKIYRTNYIFRGIFVEAGRHTVRFEYRPSSFRRGLIISAGALSAVAALIAFDWTARRRRSTPNDA